MLSNKKEEKKGMSADEIRAMREQERLDSVYPEPTAVHSGGRRIMPWLVVLGLTAVLLAAGMLLYDWLMKGLLYLDGFLSGVDFDRGLLTESVFALLRSGVVLALALIIGHFLKIDMDGKCAPFAEWGKSLRTWLIVALAADVLFLLGSWLSGESIELTTTPGMYPIVYYIIKIFFVPLENVVLFAAVPSQIIGHIAPFVFDSKKKSELPLMISSTVILAVAQLGMSWEGIVGADIVIIAYALIQSAVCSVLYHRSGNVWVPTAVYSAVTVLYYLMSWLLSMI